MPFRLCRYDLNRIFFGGFFIRGHPYTMETISFAIRFWSKARSSPEHACKTLCVTAGSIACDLSLLSAFCLQGEMAAMFLRHEGFLGAGTLHGKQCRQPMAARRLLPLHHFVCQNEAQCSAVPPTPQLARS